MAPMLPAGHCEQAVDWAAPEKLPALHDWHVAEEDAPAAVEYVPALHWEGLTLLAGQNAPDGHVVLVDVVVQ